MKRMQTFFAIFLPVILAGCTGIPVLLEPNPLPVRGRGYQVPSLSELKPRYVMAFDYLGCIEDAVVSSCGFSGKTSIAGRFGVRKIVEREFGLAGSANFASAEPGRKADGVVYVEMEKLAVSKSWSNYSAEAVFDIEVVSLAVAGRQRIFRKKYRVSDVSHEKGGDEKVPLCVYSCVQQAVERFVDDLAMCQDIAEFCKRNP